MKTIVHIVLGVFFCVVLLSNQGCDTDDLDYDITDSGLNSAAYGDSYILPDVEEDDYSVPASNYTGTRGSVEKLMYPRIGDSQIYCSQDFREKLEVPPDVDVEDFYEPLTKIEHPYYPGTLIRYQLITKTPDIAKGHLVYRVLYVSTMRQVKDGKESDIPIATSGLISIPKAEKGKIKTGLQTLLYTHGTLGIQPACGSSRWVENMTDEDIEPWMFDSNLKTAAPDYPGLGYDSNLRSSDLDVELSANAYWGPPWYWCSKGMKPFKNSAHPYVSVEAEGRSAIDIVRASYWLERVLRDSCTDSMDENYDFAVVGASQGGHAALAVGQLMHESKPYAPELKLRSIVAGAPASELVIKEENRNLPMVLMGYSLEFLDFRPSEYMNNQGMCNYLRHIGELCAGRTGWGMPNVNPFKVSYAELKDQLFNEETGSFLEAVEANTLGKRPIDVPVMIGQSINDPTIPADMTDRLVDRLRSDVEKKATVVTYCKYQGNVNSVPRDNHNKILSRMFDNQNNQCINATEFLEYNLLQFGDKY